MAPDSDETYTIEPVSEGEQPRDGFVVKCNGIPVRWCFDRPSAEKYATDPEYRALLVVKKLWEHEPR